MTYSQDIRLKRVPRPAIVASNPREAVKIILRPSCPDDAVDTGRATKDFSARVGDAATVEAYKRRNSCVRFQLMTVLILQGRTDLLVRRLYSS